MKTRIVKETFGDGGVRYLPQYAMYDICVETGRTSERWQCADELRIVNRDLPVDETPCSLEWAQKTIDRILSSEVVCSEVIEYP